MGEKENGQSGKSWAETAGTGDRNSVFFLSGTAGYVAALLGAVFLMMVCPAVVIYMIEIFRNFDGSVVEFYFYIQEKGLMELYSLWPRPSAEAWKIYAVYGTVEAVLQLFLPGKTFHGPISPKGNIPVYVANGVQSYVVTILLFFVGWWFSWFDPGRIYDLMGEILAASNYFSLLLCAFLTAKGLYFPSSSDCGTNGSLVYDYFWGTELYPRIGKHFDIKTWTNCRMGVMSWAVIPLCYLVKQYQLYGTVSDSMIVSQIIMQAYMFKFFLWETGYWKTMDIAHDRAGYYLCWGCLNWVPGVYPSPVMFLVTHPINLGIPLATSIAFLGLLSVYINYAADVQRQEFRESNGQKLVWGKPPVIVTAKYTTGRGEEKTSLLLASGWWGIARHFHYVPEITASFFWTVPGLFGRVLPYFYVLYLTLLLADRSFRDEARCSSKYGKYWNEYCKLVPWRVVPFIF
eukprot:TRINITY_DN2057_c0_g1_i1.p1 TRINITY_DN2057_c0_g1~~TRINITY_DN2057_c0_g1_i1.p1  ORF type:complete len:470 (+),score=34.52 TRINITY_DN2057_c0_g1_i1:34-1410(+)